MVVTKVIVKPVKEIEFGGFKTFKMLKVTVPEVSDENPLEIVNILVFDK